MYNWMRICGKFYEFRVSGKSPKTAWRAAHSRQAAHAILVRFLGSMRNRRARNPRTARRHKPVP